MKRLSRYALCMCLLILHTTRSTSDGEKRRVYVDTSFFGECFTFTNETVSDLLRTANDELQCRDECEFVDDGRDADLIVAPAHKVGINSDLYGATWEEGVVCEVYHKKKMTKAFAAAMMMKIRRVSLTC